jgi:hypothetical protein
MMSKVLVDALAALFAAQRDVEARLDRLSAADPEGFADGNFSPDFKAWRHAEKALAATIHETAERLNNIRREG